MTEPNPPPIEGEDPYDYWEPPEEPPECTEPPRPLNTDEAADFTDLRAAQDVAEVYGEKVIFALGKWHAWDGKHFIVDETGAIERLAKRVATRRYHEIEARLKDARICYANAFAAGEEPSTLAPMKARVKELEANAKWCRSQQNASKLSACIELLRTEKGITRKAAELDADHWVLCAQNGEVDLRTAELLPHSKVSLCTRITNASMLDQPTPQWDAFLEWCFRGDAELVDFVQRLAGYCLIGRQIEEIVVFFYGLGANGKSTLNTTLREVMGTYAVTVRPDIFLDEGRGLTPAQESERMNLKGRRLALTTELRDGAAISSGSLKEVASSDPVSAKWMKGNRETFEPSHQIIAAVNHKPRVMATDLGTWRRIILVPFLNTIAKEDMDVELSAKLLCERNGILKWMIEGCLEYQRIGLSPPRVVLAATQEYRSAEDTVGEFISEQCVIDPSAKTGATALYQAFEEWCSEGEVDPCKQATFGKKILERGFTRRKDGKVSYIGIGLRSNFVPDEDSGRLEDSDLFSYLPIEK